MSSRMLRKVASKYKDDVDPEEVSSDETKGHKHHFDLLNLETESDSEKDTDDRDGFSKGNIKVDGDKPKKQKNKKSKSKKQYLKPKCQEMTEEEFLDSLTLPDLSVASAQNDKNNDTDVLSIKIRHLNENMELQQMFGPSATGATSVNERGRRNHRASAMKCTFGKRAPEWPQVSFTNLGLTMDRAMDKYGDDEDGYNWCVVKASAEYLQGERELKTAMRTGNFQGLQERPYHINTLLEMTMLLTNQEEFLMAADTLKRIFYIYETISPMGLSLLGSTGGGGGSLVRSHCSLDYKYRLNRGIFLALFQWVLHLCQRSCFITALEYCKLTLNLNIKNDPLAMILIIDDVALRASKFDFLIQFHDQFAHSKSLGFLPNFAFSLPLAYFLRSGVKGSQVCPEADLFLQIALSRFPGFLMALLENCKIKIDDRVARSSFFSDLSDPVSVSLLINTYMRRSLNLWKSQTVLRWLEINVHKFLDRLEQSDDEKTIILGLRADVTGIYKRIVPLAVRRHLFLSGYGSLMDQGSVSPLIFDPYPPANSEGGFDHYLDQETQTELHDSWLRNLFRSFMPSFV